MPRIMTISNRPGLVWCAALTVVLAGCQGGSPDPGGSGSASPGAAQATAGWVAERVDVGGHQLHTYCKGAGSPTIVFENGLEDSLGTWFQAVANAFPSVRTCAYDRVNTGLSDRVPARHTGEDSVHDLHTLLDAAAVPPPYLLVGHSFGGLLSAMYAGSYPTEVVGLVLLDPTRPTQADPYKLIPERDRAAAVAGNEKNAEKVEFVETLEQAKALVPKIPNIPVLVLAATKPDGMQPTWLAEDIAARKQQLQDFTDAVPGGELRYVDSGHYIHRGKPQLVIGEIQRMLESVR
jgi:pimeloyl-ACP methyl ester carboxylesterase